MKIHELALVPTVTPADVYRATEEALLTTHVGNGPTQIFMIGRDEKQRLLEITAVVRHEDILVVHADVAREEYLPLLAELPERPADAPGYGRAADGVVLTDELVDGLFHQAENGYDVEFLSDRTRPGRPAPMTVGTVIRLGLDSDLKDAVSRLATSREMSEAALIDELLTESLSAAIGA